MKRKITLRI